MQKLFNRLEEVYEEIVEIRRHLHANPELSFKEVNTAKYIAEFHEKLGHETKGALAETGLLLL